MTLRVAGATSAFVAVGALLLPPAAASQSMLYVQMCSDQTRSIAIPIDRAPDGPADHPAGCHAACMRGRDFDPADEE